VTNNSEIEKFQRWLQSELAESYKIEDSEERNRRLQQIEIAIAEAIRYRELANLIGGSVAAPFVEREEPVRSTNSDEVKPVTSDAGECPSCGAPKSADIDFCTVCGDY